MNMTFDCHLFYSFIRYTQVFFEVFRCFCFFMRPVLFEQVFILEMILPYCELSRLMHDVGGQIAMYLYTTAQPE